LRLLAAACSSNVELLGRMIAGVDVLQDALFLPGPESRENQDRLAIPALAQFGALGGASHAKPVRAGA